VERGLEARNKGSRWWRAAYERHGSLIGVIAPREIAASVGPAQRNGKAAALTGGLAHDVSIVLRVGRHLGRRMPGSSLAKAALAALRLTP
jgi:hypothetical protein